MDRADDHERQHDVDHIDSSSNSSLDWVVEQAQRIPEDLDTMDLDLEAGEVSFGSSEDSREEIEGFGQFARAETGAARTATRNTTRAAKRIDTRSRRTPTRSGGDGQTDAATRNRNKEPKEGNGRKRPRETSVERGSAKRPRRNYTIKNQIREEDELADQLAEEMDAMDEEDALLREKEKRERKERSEKKKRIIREIRRTVRMHPQVDIENKMDGPLLQKLNKKSVPDLEDILDSVRLQVTDGVDAAFLKTASSFFYETGERLFNLPGFTKDCQDDEALQQYLRMSAGKYLGYAPALGKAIGSVVGHAAKASTRRVTGVTSGQL